MQALDIENALTRLIPTALSQDATNSIEAMLDELAAESPNENPKFGWLFACTKPVAAAAAILLTFSGGIWFVSQGDSPTKIVHSDHIVSAGLELINKSERVESVEDEGWFTSPDGGEMHAVRIRMVEENSFRDEETGIVMRITEPREEVMYMPVSTF